MTQSSAMPSAISTNRDQIAAVLALAYPSLTTAQMLKYYGVSSSVLSNLRSSKYSYASSNDYIAARAVNDFIWERIWFGANTKPSNSSIYNYLTTHGTSSNDGPLSPFWYQMEALFQKARTGADILAATLTIDSSNAAIKTVGSTLIYGPFTVTSTDADGNTSAASKAGIAINLNSANTYVNASNTAITSVSSDGTFYVRLPRSLCKKFPVI